jgi:hypothetical protein
MPYKDMNDARHAVVEYPDGSVAIAFNQEVPSPEPPEPPPEIIQPLPRFRLLLEYHPVVRALAYIFVLASGINLALFGRIIDIINFVLIVSTTGALHTEHSASITGYSVSWYVCGAHDSAILCTSNVGTSYLPIFNRYDVYHRI